MLGGGRWPACCKFDNNDLAEGRNLLGRMALAIGMTMNAQNQLGLTLDGKVGRDLFTVARQRQWLHQQRRSGWAAMQLRRLAHQFAASDYEVRFHRTDAGAGGAPVRRQDHRVHQH